jgi:hypothetical protein
MLLFTGELLSKGLQKQAKTRPVSTSNVKAESIAFLDIRTGLGS